MVSEYFACESGGHIFFLLPEYKVLTNNKATENCVLIYRPLYLSIPAQTALMYNFTQFHPLSALPHLTLQISLFFCSTILLLIGLPDYLSPFLFVPQFFSPYRALSLFLSSFVLRLLSYSFSPVVPDEALMPVSVLAAGSCLVCLSTIRRAEAVSM